MLRQRAKSFRAIFPIVALVLAAGCGSGSGGDLSEDAPTAADAANPPPADPNPPPPANVPNPPPASVPSPPSVITDVRFAWNSHRRMAQGSDNWPTTWSNDNHQYALWGDGGGFGGSDGDGRSSFGVARIEGGRDNYQGVNRFGGKSGECRSNIDGKAHGAPLSVGGVLYAWVTPGSNAQGYRAFTLYRSRNKGCSWTRLDVRFVLSTDGVSFGSFVQFGKDNSLAPDAYVYSIATAVTNTESLAIVQRPGKIMLLRVPLTAIEDRGAYEFYAGQDSTAQPIWSSNPARKVAIYEDRDGVGPFAQMSYVPGLDRLVYTNQHGSGADRAGMRSLLTMAEAPQPWGPWSVFYKDLFFPQIEHSVFQWSFAPKWFRNGGREFTLVFSGTGDNDSWNTVHGVLTTAP